MWNLAPGGLEETLRCVGADVESRNGTREMEETENFLGGTQGIVVETSKEDYCTWVGIFEGFT